jgi:hypothetical protein
VDEQAVERFLYWIRERHAIYLKRRRGEPPPWTEDEILRSYFFTNPYRENDKTTVWFRENVRDGLRNSWSVVLATVIFRWFNYIPTGEELLRRGLLTRWSSKRALATFSKWRERKEKVFTGAFMINSPPGMPKLEAICERIDNVWRDRERLRKDWYNGEEGTLKRFHHLLTRYPGLGGFMAYEVVCDLRYTSILEEATDVLTWCNPGPGCCRGLHRITGKTIPAQSAAEGCPRPPKWEATMRALLSRCRKDFPDFEMREVEHSLCEFDKYERARTGSGQMKRRYKWQ